MSTALFDKMLPIERKLLLAIAVLIPIAFFLRLNSYQLLFEEPRRALVALEMLIAKNWLIPTTNGELYYNKPPLYNWILIGFLKLFGTSEWVVRLPSILSLFATAALHFNYSKRYIGTTPALLSSLFYITSADILFYFSLLGEIDLFYALIVYLQAMLIFHFYQRKQFHWLFLTSYLLTAAGVLTKGIPSLFFQAITLLLIFLLNRDYKRIFSIWHFAGILLLVFTAGTYFYLYSREQDVSRYLARLFTETFSRTGMERGFKDSLLHFGNFPLMLFKIASPWVLLFLIRSPEGWRKHLRANSFLRFCVWFCVANGVLYLLSPGTRERYLYMFLPFIFSLICTDIFDKETQKQNWIRLFYKFIGIVIVIGLTGIGIFGLSLGAWISASICLILAALSMFFLINLKAPTHLSTLLAAAALVLAGRIGFNLVILPTKKQDQSYRADAWKMSELIKGEPVYLTGEPEVKTDDVKFAGKQFGRYVRKEPAYLAFQTSYYLSAFTGRIVYFTEKKDLKGYYLSREEFTDLSKIKPLYRFNNRLGKTDQWYILYKVL